MVFVFTLFAAGAVFVFFGKMGEKNKKPLTVYQKKAVAMLSSDAASQTMLDSDNDGLKNWEEMLWKTNPKKADTDGDGYSDKEETSQGYDPLDPSSNPKTGKKAPTENSMLSSKINKDINLTQQVSKTASQEIFNAKNLSDINTENPLSSLDPGSAQTILGFLNNFNPSLPNEAIKTTNDNSLSAIEKYEEEITKAIPPLPYPDLNEDDILRQAIETGDFKKIDEFISYYDKAIAGMKNVIVPSDLFKIHKRETELLMATREVYKSIKEIKNDPLKTVLALQENEKIREEMASLIHQSLLLEQKLVQEQKYGQ